MPCSPLVRAVFGGDRGDHSSRTPRPVQSPFPVLPVWHTSPGQLGGKSAALLVWFHLAYPNQYAQHRTQKWACELFTGLEISFYTRKPYVETILLEKIIFSTLLWRITQNWSRIFQTRPPAWASDDRSALCKLLEHQHVLSWNCRNKYLILAETGVSDMKLILHKCLQCRAFSPQKLFVSSPNIYFSFTLCAFLSVLQHLRHWVQDKC